MHLRNTRLDDSPTPHLRAPRKPTIQDIPEPSGNEYQANYLCQGMGVSYDGAGSPLIKESTRGIWTAGRRCPDVWLKTSTEEEPKRLYDLVAGKYGKHLVLKIGQQSNGSALPDGLQDVARLFGVAPHKAETRTTIPEDSSSTEESFTAEWVGDDDDFTVVVRPDMYIGYVDQGDGWKEYLAYLTQ